MFRYWPCKKFKQKIVIYIHKESFSIFNEYVFFLKRKGTRESWTREQWARELKCEDVTCSHSRHVMHTVSPFSILACATAFAWGSKTSTFSHIHGLMGCFPLKGRAYIPSSIDREMPSLDGARCHHYATVAKYYISLQRRTSCKLRTKLSVDRSAGSEKLKLPTASASNLFPCQWKEHENTNVCLNSFGCT